MFRIGLLSMESVLTPLAKSVLIPLELIAGASAIDTAITFQKKNLLIREDYTDNMKRKR